MKKMFLLLIAAVFCQLQAEILIWQDNGKKACWAAAGKKFPAVFSNGITKTSAPYFSKVFHQGTVLTSINPDGGNLPGNKLKFTIEARGKGDFQIGIRNCKNYRLQGWSKKLKLTDKFTTYSFEYTLTEFAPRVRCMIRGIGEFRNAKLYNMRKAGYAIRLYPAYQLYSTVPEKVSFELLYKGKPVKKAKLQQRGNFVFDPESGVTAQIYAHKGSSASFDAAAEKIKIDKPLNILYLGDSLTHFAQGYNHADKTVWFLNKFNPRKVTLFNCAVRGDTSSQTLLRLQKKAKDRFVSRFSDFWNHKYDIAFIFLGQNDSRAHVRTQYKSAFVPPVRQEKNYRRIIEILRQHGVKRIIIISCASLDAEKMKRTAAELAKTRPLKHALYGKPELLEQFNNVSQKLAKELNLEYIDIYTPMKALPDKPSLFLDGAHLNDKGHNFVALQVLKYLAANQQK